MRLSVRGVFLGGLICALSVVAQAQVNSDAYRDYFLMGQFGEVCTMCEVVVLCEEGAVSPSYERIPAEGDFTVYYIQTRTFWSQISTIWEWFIANFRTDALAARGHTRPVWVYEINDSTWSAPEVIAGRLILEPGVIELGDKRIERVKAEWQQDNVVLGYCQRMPLWESIDAINDNAGEGEA
ncbi:MAG: hypothetical protein P8M26_06010 [Gammaproteobacteria bacterium]|nr:hypothetical protein [Gammaproteobacteria bacterium]